MLLCFSTISPVSFEKITEKWAPEIDHYLANVPHILVGTKKDLREAKYEDPTEKKFTPVYEKDGTALAKQIGCACYMEVSSKEGTGVTEVMQKAVELVMSQRGATSKQISSSGSVVKKAQRKSNCSIV